MKRKSAGQKHELRKIVKERIAILLALAKKEQKDKPKRSKRYIELAQKLGTRYNIRLSREQRTWFCKKCRSAWIPGYNVKVRVRSREGAVEYLCQCGNALKLPYKKEGKRLKNQ